MDAMKFNHDSLRAQEARLTVAITPTWRWFLKLGGALALISGLALLLINQVSGWLALAVGTILIMIYKWWRWRLYRLPTNEKKGATIDDLLSSSVLGRLPANPTPRDIAGILAHTSSGLFLAVRFGLGPKFFQELATTDLAGTDKIWENAIALRKKTKSETISGGLLAISMIKSFPNYEALIARLQLDFEDLIQGVKWHDYVHSRSENERRQRRTGGFARDWAFGFTPTLNNFGQNISEQLIGTRLMAAELPEYTKSLKQLISTFSSNGRQNAVIVGPNGSGKTTLIYSFADKLIDADSQVPTNLKFRQVFMLDAVSLIQSAPGRGELEQLVNQILAEGYSAQNIIICFDNAEVFFEEGTGTVDLTNILLPILEAGKVRIILAMEEQGMLKISNKNSNLANSLNKIFIKPSNEKDTMVILGDRIIPIEQKNQAIFMYQALKEAYRLSSRYVHDLAMPGRAIKLLESAVGFKEGSLITSRSVQQAIESTANVKISAVDSAKERETLLNLEDLIHKRMINQKRAVSVVSDALRRARAGVRNQNRPIGTFLFLGPTGVGKTELSKALADVYFNDEDSLIRVNLNEYVTINDVARLVADGAVNPNSLTAQVMNRPFSVILLDEIEKAHPAVLAALLQLLDEGILRDVNSREISFRDSIVIATSNAGADRIREYIERGYQLENFEKQFVDELISSQQFRSEFLNRFDEIVVFRPLDKPELIEVINLIIDGVNKTLSIQKISVEVSEEAKAFLVDYGYDPRLGARPMRRVVQSTVENIIAKQVLVAGGSLAGNVIKIGLDQVKDTINTKSE